MEILSSLLHTYTQGEIIFLTSLAIILAIEVVPFIIVLATVIFKITFVIILALLFIILIGIEEIYQCVKKSTKFIGALIENICRKK